MINIDECNHDFGKWKKMKKDILDLESDEDDSPSFLGTVFHRKCKKCGLVDTRFEKRDNKKVKSKNLTLKKK